MMCAVILIINNLGEERQEKARYELYITIKACIKRSLSAFIVNTPALLRAAGDGDQTGDNFAAIELNKM